MNADASNASFSLYHKTSLALIAATPFAIAMSNSTVGTAIDVAMGLAIPVHAHIGMNWVLTDYVRRDAAARADAHILHLSPAPASARSPPTSASHCDACPPFSRARLPPPPPLPSLGRVDEQGPKLIGAGGTQGARVVMVGLTAVATLGMLKLNLTGDGLTETVKAMWRPQKVQA